MEPMPTAQQSKHAKKNLKDARKLTLLSARAFAQKYGFNVSTYQAWEEGRYKKGIKLSYVSKIIHALAQENIACTTEWILLNTGAPPTRRLDLYTANSKDLDAQEILDRVHANKNAREKNISLIEAIKSNKITTVRNLLAAGANLHALSDRELYVYSLKQNTALHFAAIYAGSPMVKIFIELGLNPNIRNRYNEAPLHLAAYEGNFDAVVALVDSEAAIDCANNEGTTPLIWAAYAGREKICEKLIAAGAQVNNTDFLGNTAMHYAAYGNQTHVISLLYEKGARVSSKNHDGETPLEFAIKNGQAEAAKMLMKYSGAWKKFV